MKRQALASIAAVLILAPCTSRAADDKPQAVAPVKLQQIISREDPQFNCQQASLTIGRDGMVYLTSPAHDSGYILRVSRDGRDKLGGASVAAIHNATADAAGLIAAAHGHFSHQVAIYDKEFHKTLAVTDFLVSDQVGWDAPGSVEAGASGDFYGLDQHRDRILQLNADGKIVKAYALPHIDKCPAQAFRVCEKAQAFYVVCWGKPEVQCLGFDGKVKWERPLGVGVQYLRGRQRRLRRGPRRRAVHHQLARQRDPQDGAGRQAGRGNQAEHPARAEARRGHPRHAPLGRRSLPAGPAPQRVVPGLRPGHRRVQAFGEHRPRAADRDGPGRPVDRRRSRSISASSSTAAAAASSPAGGSGPGPSACWTIAN